jgi:hypothetical protein
LRITELKNLEENKDESKENDRYLNHDETIVEITRDSNSIFRCLAHQIKKKEILF